MSDTLGDIGSGIQDLLPAFRRAADNTSDWMRDPRNRTFVQWAGFGVGALLAASFIPAIIGRMGGGSWAKMGSTLALGIVLASAMGNWAARGFKMDEFGKSFTDVFDTLKRWTGVSEERNDAITGRTPSAPAPVPPGP